MTFTRVDNHVTEHLEDLLSASQLVLECTLCIVMHAVDIIILISTFTKMSVT